MVKKLFLAAAVSVLFLQSSHAMLMKGYNIEQLSSKAEKIFLGEVIETKESSAGQSYPYVEVTFAVLESLKGSVPSVFTFRQFAPKVGKNLQPLGIGKNAYRKGEKLLMFLGGESSKGLASPVDMQLFLIQSKTTKQSEIDSSVVLSKTFGRKMNDRLFSNLEKEPAKEAWKNILSKRKSQKVGKTMEQGVSFGEMRKMIRASL